MAFRRGFKSSARDLAKEIRAELDIDSFDPLDVHTLAEWLAVPVISLSSMEAEAPAVGHLLRVEREVFSAVTVFCGSRRTIVHNDGHAPVRQRSNISHELSHALLLHPPTPALDDKGCRNWNQDIEDEANWLSGCLLVPEEAALEIARGRWTTTEVTRRFDVSPAMIQFRLNATGARTRVRRAAERGGKAA